MHRVHGHAGVEGETREDRSLLRGVVALDVRSRVGLRIAEALGVGQRLGEVVAVLVHAVEYVVRGAVDDAEDAADPVAGEAVPQRTDDRDRAADRRLVVQLSTHLLRQIEELWAVIGHQRLVRGDDVGAGLQCLQDERAGGLDAADQLHHDVRAEDERLGVGGEELARDVGGTYGVQVPDGHADQLQARTRTGGELVAVLEQQRRDLRTDAAAAEDGDPEVAVLDHARTPISLLRRSSSVSPRTISRAAPSSTATTGGRPR